MNEKKKTLIQLVSFGIICFLLGVSFVYAQISQTHVISGGVYPGAPDATIWSDNAGNYYAKNAYGVIISSGSNATTVINSTWATMTNGGKILLIGHIDLETAGLTFNLAKLGSGTPKGLILEGLGYTQTKINYTGTGYAITVMTSDAALGQYDVVLRDFYIECETLTAGRNGISIDEVGRIAVLDHVRVHNADIAFDIGVDPNNTNTVYFRNCDADVANTGFKTSPASTNEISFYDCRALSTNDYGFYFNGGASIRLFSGLIAHSGGYGLYGYGTHSLLVEGVRFENNAANDGDIYLDAADFNWPVDLVKIVNCKFDGSANSDYAIILADSTRDFCIDTCKSYKHNVAFINFANTVQGITIINPDISTVGVDTGDPYLLDGTQTLAYSIFPGIVIEPRRIGVIVKNAAGGAVAEKDVVVPNGWGTYGTTTTANDDCPSVVMYGQADGKPIVICVSGVTPVTVDGNIEVTDTIVTQNIAKTAFANNATTDPKQIIGYSLTTEASNTTYVKVLG